MDYVRQALAVGDGPSAVVAGDLDDDGHLDLIVANGQSGDLSVFRGDGAGGMMAQARVPAGENPADLALADLDGDGDADVVVANHATDYLTILFGDGSGALLPASNSPLRIDVSPHPHAVRAVDVDLDGRVDLVVDHRAGRGLLILRGLGGGVFESPGKLVEVGGDPYRGMAIADVNGDGRLDFATPNPAEVGILLGVDSERLRFRRAAPVAAASPFAVELADLNGDGILDLVSASETAPIVQVFFGDGEGGFREARDSHLRMAAGAKKIARGDFNGDGVDDAAIASFQSSEVLLLLGGAEPIRTARLQAGENPWGLAAADLNEDGRDDLVVVDYAHPRAYVYVSGGRKR